MLTTRVSRVLSPACAAATRAKNLPISQPLYVSCVSHMPSACELDSAAIEDHGARFCVSCFYMEMPSLAHMIAAQ